jgi:hypothetical protein
VGKVQAFGVKGQASVGIANLVAEELLKRSLLNVLLFVIKLYETS